MLNKFILRNRNKTRNLWRRFLVYLWIF